ncbi:hypothetical protein ACJZ2D_005036 [Fusarium nematophilum]
MTTLSDEFKSKYGLSLARIIKDHAPVKVKFILPPEKQPGSKKTMKSSRKGLRRQEGNEDDEREVVLREGVSFRPRTDDIKGLEHEGNFVLGAPRQRTQWGIRVPQQKLLGTLILR